MAAALLFVLSLNVGFAFDGFTIGNLRRMQQNFHSVPLLQTRNGHFDVHLALARKQKFFRLRFAHVAQAKIFIHHLMNCRTDFIFVTARLRFDRE